MSIAMLSAISLICMDAGLAAWPLPVTAPAAAIQAAAAAPDLTAPPVD